MGSTIDSESPPLGIHDRDGSGSTATPVRAPNVSSGCNAGSEWKHTSSPDEGEAKSREGSRLSDPFQEEKMGMTRGWTGLGTAIIAVGLIAWSAPNAAADSISQNNILQYSTSGAIGTSGVTGAGNVISFVPVQNASVDTESNISLGYFQVAGLSAGQSTTYDNTPITLTLVPSAFNSTTISDPPITVTGYLNGTVTGPYQSSVQVSFNAISSPTFTVPNGSGTLILLKNDQQLLVPSSVNNGQTTLQAQIATSGLPTPAPEPSTIALFLSTVGGLGLRRYVQKRRQRATA
jgi:hypothetical protein